MPPSSVPARSCQPALMHGPLQTHLGALSLSCLPCHIPVQPTPFCASGSHPGTASGPPPPPPCCGQSFFQRTVLTRHLKVSGRCPHSPEPLLTAPPFPFTSASVWTVSSKAPLLGREPAASPSALAPPSQSSAPAPLCPSPSSVPTVPSGLHAPFPPRGTPAPDCEFSFPCHFQLPVLSLLSPPK